MRKAQDSVVHSDPDIMSGTPVFVGTRVPFRMLIDYIEAGQPLSEFLDDFPTVSEGTGDRCAGASQGSPVRPCASCLTSACPAG